MKNSISIGLILGMTMLSFHVESQEHFKCGSHTKMQEVFAAYPGLEQDHQQLLENSKTTKTNAEGERGTVYIIPVVFHIIHEYGAENISDAQVYDQINILNEDFRKLNGDTSDIVTSFKPLATDAEIEFRLASIDPFGNCTNGIEHINSHETNMGDDPSKLNQWPRSRYLNVWVVKNMENGVAGYAYYPSAVSGGMYYADGIIIRHNYIGSIGTSAPYYSRALTHEIGHYLGLPHTWGNTNDPEVSCGDDGISDTPETAGHTSCILTATDNCNAGVEENVQNYMEYAYCSRMFTYDQVQVMRTVLNDLISSRDNLWTAENHTITGIDVTAPLCAPEADFFADRFLVCAGQDVNFNSTSWRAPVDTYSWSFPGGTPSSSNSVSPTVTYNTPGTYSVTLTVTNAAGTTTKTMEQAVTVQGDWWEYMGPHSESFESGAYPPHWIAVNGEQDASVFEVHENVGYSGNHAVGVIYHKSNLDPILDLNYWERIGGSKEILITPVYNLDNTTSAELTFKFAHATISGGLFQGEDLSLKVFYSTNCGATWTMMQNLQGMDVLSAGQYSGYFSPTNGSDWYGSSITIPPAALQDKVRFKFEFTANDFSNNFFLDDINVEGILLTEENSLEVTDVSVYPNPVTSMSNIKLNFSLLESENVSVVMYDVLGNIVLTSSYSGLQGNNMLEIPMGEYGFSAGVYSIAVMTDSGSETVKLIIQ